MPRRGAGRFQYPAVFETRAGGADQFGNPATRWVTYARRRVHLDETAGGESLEGGVLQGDTRAQLMVRRDAMLAALPTDARVFVKGRYWHVLAMSEGDRHDTAQRDTLMLTLDEGPPT